MYCLIGSLLSSTLDRQQAYQKDKTCGIEGGTTLISFKNITNAKTSTAVARKTQQIPPKFNAPDDGRVDRNM
jgi:hypothetical protein